MSSKSKEIFTKQKNKKKRKVELEALNQQNNEEQQTHKSYQICGAKQPKFKSPFIPEMKKSLSIDAQDSWFLLRDPNCK